MGAPEGYFPASAMPDGDWWSVLWPDPEGVLRRLGVAPGTVVLDLCCGDGHFTVPLARILDGAVYGLDIDPEMLAQARAALDAAGAGVRGLICGDARDLADLLPEAVDFVLIANTFHGAPDKTGFSRAVQQVLKTGGRFAIVNWYRRPREETTVLDQPRGPDTELRMEPNDVRQVVEPAGFTLEKVVDVGPYHYGVVFLKI